MNTDWFVQISTYAHESAILVFACGSCYSKQKLILTALTFSQTMERKMAASISIADNPVTVLLLQREQ